MVSGEFQQHVFRYQVLWNTLCAKSIPFAVTLKTILSMEATTTVSSSSSFGIWLSCSVISMDRCKVLVHMPTVELNGFGRIVLSSLRANDFEVEFHSQGFQSDRYLFHHVFVVKFGHYQLQDDEAGVDVMVAATGRKRNHVIVPVDIGQQVVKG
ncbi:hypothetical protein CEXT_815881 [Caerostris extrusa]|uniref:Galectin n=1 Tax=Caerostris extrusa TaxID=172846 RepID=A0AAV4SV89_CAEEX|nr:hypothetical protein CEXT_815881 [Caerostris extrusa]